jgi:phosphoribosyl 1,2-cyclic phosphodiesterase
MHGNAAASGCDGFDTEEGEKSSAVIRFWGVRGSIPTPGPETVRTGGNTSCIEVRADGEHIVLDAGSGMRPLGKSLVAEFAEIPLNLTLLITHTHWDHIQGFPFFIPAYNPRNHVRILGYEGARKDLQATLAGQMESPYFPIALAQMPGNIVIEELKSLDFRVGKIAGTACHVNHPGVCVGYRLNTSSGSICYIPDHESAPIPDEVPESVAHVLERKIVDFIDGADVLILDSQYTAEEYRTHVGWGHGCLDDVVRVAKLGKVKRLFLFHHDPSHDDSFLEGMLAHAQSIAGSALEVALAREGECIILAGARA